MPLLHQLYEIEKLSAQQTYILAILLLILSADDGFCDAANKRMVRGAMEDFPTYNVLPLCMVHRLFPRCHGLKKGLWKMFPWAASS